MIANVASIYGAETCPPLTFKVTSVSAYMHDIKRAEINWLETLPSITAVPPFMPPPLTIRGGVPFILVE
jgi:hypothetical protein